MADRLPDRDPLLLIDYDKASGSTPKFRFKISVPPKALFWLMSILAGGSTGWMLASKLPDIAKALGH